MMGTRIVGPWAPTPAARGIQQYDSSMSRILPHLQRDTKPIFVTFNTDDHWILPPEGRDIVLDSCRHDHLKTMDLHIAVVMPDHAHIILTPLADQDRVRMYPVSEIVWAIKSASAHRINKLLGRHGKVWQDEYFDTVIHRSEKLQDKVEYVRQNPVRAGLVASAEDYKWMWELPRPRAAAAPQLLGR
jgi:REP element-mobilizing transposase RayT